MTKPFPMARAVALALLIAPMSVVPLAVAGGAQARPHLSPGGRVACDERDRLTCNARGWRERRAPRRKRMGASRVRAIAARRVRAKRPAGISLARVVAPLAAKVDAIVDTCGSHVVSAVRHTLVAGTGRVSLHSSGEAVDVRGNPSCIYAMLRGWPGGYSVDYARVRHVHVSYDPQHRREWGARFVHGGGHHHRYAHRPRHYAMR